MEEQIIELKFDKITTNLAGNKLGRIVYATQAKEKIDINKINIINLEDNIEDVAMSFIQGFCHEILEKVGKEKAKEIIKVRSSHKGIVDKFNKTMLI